MSLFRTFSFSGEKNRVKPFCGITVASAGPMKSGRDDLNRKKVYESIGIPFDRVLSLTQTHSQNVFIASCAKDFENYPEGDGILTTNTTLIPSVMVADCLPVWLYNPVVGCFGVLHSGWKGTGILKTALQLAHQRWGARASDFYIIFGPHIRSCCYTVDDERSNYFTRFFSSSCVTVDDEKRSEDSKWYWRLSLVEANKQIARDLGVLDSHVQDVGECTSCNSLYGSNRREGAEDYTHMAAFIGFDSTSKL